MKNENKEFANLVKMIDEHLKYEIDNFLFSVNYLSISHLISDLDFPFPIPVIHHDILKHINLENWVMGFRKFYDFLFNTKKHANSDWFLASHCFKTPVDWHNIIGESGDLLKKEFSRTHSMSAHISYTRINDKTKYEGWDIGIAELVIEKLNIFFDSLYNKENKDKVKIRPSERITIFKNNDGFYEYGVKNAQ
jgi:hypothetical protein